MVKGFSYLESSFQKCPLCGSESFEILHNTDRLEMGIKTVGCMHCGLIQSNPRPSENGLNVFYSRDYRRFYQNVVKPSDSYILNTKKNERMDYTVKYLNSTIDFSNINSVLDFGCSEGALFEALIRDGYNRQLLGVEPNEDFANFIRLNRNIQVYPSIDKIDKSFDLIILIHVFEHLLYPNLILEKILLNIKEGGYIYIDVPDADEYTDLSSLHIAHIYHFTTGTLKAMLEKAGFTVLTCEKHNPPFHPKSVRILARYFSESKVKGEIPTAQSELNTWLKVKRISTIFFLLKKRLSKYKILRIMYKRILGN
jgi:SAM-dependent methyltransferase